jgi:hypothetical protein
MVLSEAFHIAMSFKYFFTIKYSEWYEPQLSLDKKVKLSRKKELVSEYFDASKIEDDNTTTYSTPLTLYYDSHNTRAHDG